MPNKRFEICLTTENCLGISWNSNFDLFTFFLTAETQMFYKLGDADWQCEFAKESSEICK